MLGTVPKHSAERQTRVRRTRYDASIPIGLWSLLLLALPYSATLALAPKVVLWGTLALAYPRLERAKPAAFLGLDKAPHVGWLFGGAVFIAGYSLLIHGGRVDLPPISAF